MEADRREQITSLNPKPQSLTWVIFLHFSFSYFRCFAPFQERQSLKKQTCTLLYVGDCAWTNFVTVVQSLVNLTCVYKYYT